MLQRVLTLFAPKFKLRKYNTSRVTVDVRLTYTSSKWYVFVGMWIMANPVFI
jgi:hypothetical protein